MKVGFQASLLRGRRTGISNYAINLLGALSALDSAIQFVSPGVYGWQRIDIDEMRQAVAAASNPKQRVWDFVERRLKDVYGARRLRRKLVSMSFGWANRGSSITLFHAFNYVPPGNMHAPVLPVVYDLSFLRHPDMHPAERIRVLADLPKTIERAPRVQTISAFSRREIVDLLGFPADRIGVAYPAAAAFYRPLGMEVTSADLRHFELLVDHYFLAVGTIEPRKNLRTIIAAYSRLSAATRSRYPLVIVGGDGWGEIELPRETNQLVGEGCLRFVGYVSDQVLRSLYEGATLMAFPSVYEGFGMPVVEAMACGTPVAHSENTAMDEISGGLAFRVPANDVVGWSNVFKESLAEAENLTEISRLKRIDQAHSFKWADSAKLVRDLYRQILLA